MKTGTNGLTSPLTLGSDWILMVPGRNHRSAVDQPAPSLSASTRAKELYFILITSYTSNNNNDS